MSETVREATRLPRRRPASSRAPRRRTLTRRLHIDLLRVCSAAVRLR